MTGSPGFSQVVQCNLAGFAVGKGPTKIPSGVIPKLHDVTAKLSELQGKGSKSHDSQPTR